MPPLQNGIKGMNITSKPLSFIIHISATVFILTILSLNLIMYSNIQKYREICTELAEKARPADFYYQRYRDIMSQKDNFKDEHALLYLSIAANMNHDDAQVSMADVVADVALKNPRYQDAEREWLRKAAQNGKAENLYAYAAHIGFPIEAWEHYLSKEQREQREKDLQEAVVCYGKAAAQGHIKSMRRLAQYSLKGIGCKKDLNTALYWAKKVYAYEEAHHLEPNISLCLGEIYLELGRVDLAEPYLERSKVMGDPRVEKLLNKAHRLQASQNGKSMRTENHP